MSNYRGYGDVAFNYDWAQRKTATPVTIGTVHFIAERYGFRGGPPRVDLMAKASANDNLVEASASSDDPDNRRLSRWPQLTRRGADIFKMPPAGMLVPDWLRDKGFTIVLAQRGTGKTVLTVSLALSVASDSDWMGEQVKSDFYAVYLCGEDAENTVAHVEAWCKRYNKGEVPERFTFISDVPDLTSANDCKALAEHIRTFVPVGARAVIIVDTWQRATSRAQDGQNSDRDMALAVENLEALAREFDGPALGCFHPPKAVATTVLGSSVTENTSTGIWLLTATEAGLKLEVTRIKGPGLGNFKYLSHEKVLLGRYDEFGRQATGVVATCIGGTVSDSDPREAEKAARQAVFNATVSLLNGGIAVVRGNGAGQKPADVAKVVREAYNIRMDGRAALAHLNALEREGRLIYVQADKNRRIKAGYHLPSAVVSAESSAESVPKAIPNDAEGF
jgi:hypothetical protein